MATKLKDPDRSSVDDDYAQLISVLEQLQDSERERSAAQRKLVDTLKRLEQQSARMRRQLPDLFA